MIAVATTAGSRFAQAMSGSGRAVAGNEPIVLADRLLQSFPRRRGLAVIGAAHQQDMTSRKVRGRATLSEAIEQVLGHLDLSKEALGQMPAPSLQALIRARTADDFAEGRIVSVQGWLLAETEAALCEIAALRGV